MTEIVDNLEIIAMINYNIVVCYIALCKVRPHKPPAEDDSRAESHHFLASTSDIGGIKYLHRDLKAADYIM